MEGEVNYKNFHSPSLPIFLFSSYTYFCFLSLSSIPHLNFWEGQDFFQYYLWSSLRAIEAGKMNTVDLVLLLLGWESLLREARFSRAQWQIASDDCTSQWTMCLSENNFLFPLVREIKITFISLAERAISKLRFSGYNLLFIWLLREHNKLQSENTCLATFGLPNNFLSFL